MFQGRPIMKNVGLGTVCSLGMRLIASNVAAGSASTHSCRAEPVDVVASDQSTIAAHISIDLCAAPVCQQSPVPTQSQILHHRRSKPCRRDFIDGHGGSFEAALTFQLHAGVAIVARRRDPPRGASSTSSLFDAECARGTSSRLFDAECARGAPSRPDHTV